MSWLTTWLILGFASWFGRTAQTAATANGLAARTTAVNLTISSHHVAPDGFPRAAILAGKQGEEPTLPSPIISGHRGDRFLVNIVDISDNMSNFSTAEVYWHGVPGRLINEHPPGENTHITQTPTYPSNSFLYDFTIHDQAGTLWYHSQHDIRYCDGLRGALIVRDHDDPYKDWYDFDDDSTVMSLMDWYHFPLLVEPQQVQPDATLINGTGCYGGMDPCPSPATYIVQAQKRYRFRVLNMACNQSFNITIDHHAMTVIEVDGAYVEPYTVDPIQIHPAQRYSFILHADKAMDNYWIRAIPNPTVSVNTTAAAILRYTGAPNADPQTVNTATHFLNETLLRSLKEPPAQLLAPNPDVRLNLLVRNTWTNSTLFINGVRYTPPSPAVLTQIMNGPTLPAVSQMDPLPSVYFLPKDKVVEITLRVDGTDDRAHTFHMQGVDHFAVIKSADSPYRNYDKPVMRDTVRVDTRAADVEDGVTIRFITDTPGPWILYCHNGWHFWTQMAVIFVGDDADTNDRTLS